MRRKAFGRLASSNKAKDLFTSNEVYEIDSLEGELKNKIVGISSLNYITKEILNHVVHEEISPIITHKKFHKICIEKFGLNTPEKKLLEQHLLKTEQIKYSKATISFSYDNYQKEYKVIRFMNTKKSNGGGSTSLSNKEQRNMHEFHLMLFELELNQQELKDGLVQVEGRKEFIENNIQVLYKDISAEDEERREKIKLEIKKLRLFENVWMCLSQGIALIEEEFPRIKEYKDNIPKETIRMFVLETRKDLKDFEEAMQYVESTSLDEVPEERIPKWFEDEDEITDEELEQEFWKDFITESDAGDLEQYDSILQKLKSNIRNHTQSFYEPEKKLNDSLLHNYDWNEAGNKEYNDLFMMTKGAHNRDNLRRSMVIGNRPDDDEEVSESELENILNFEF